MALQKFKTIILVLVITTPSLMQSHSSYQQEYDKRHGQDYFFDSKYWEDSKEYDYTYGFNEFARNRHSRNIVTFKNFLNDNQMETFLIRPNHNIKKGEKCIL